jgi:hypothetical protein
MAQQKDNVSDAVERKYHAKEDNSVDSFSSCLVKPQIDTDQALSDD